jgi:hypothetical protein
VLSLESRCRFLVGFGSLQDKGVQDASTDTESSRVTALSAVGEPALHGWGGAERELTRSTGWVISDRPTQGQVYWGEKTRTRNLLVVLWQDCTKVDREKQKMV